jgi:chemotaxis protein histidine kinase CheA
MLGTHPKFQQAVDAQEAKLRRADAGQHARLSLERVMSALPPDSLKRFQALRSCCLELRQIAAGLKHPGPVTSATSPLDDLQVAGLDRLLWMFLRLLYTEYSLARFLSRTQRRDIDAEIARLEQQLQAVGAAGDDPQRVKIRKALEDNLATCRERATNLEQAAGNLQLVRLELDRLENKIRSLGELAIGRQEPDFIAGQVDQVAASMRETERTMSDLNFATGLEPLNEEVPSLLQSPPPLPPQKKKVRA